MKFVTLVTLEIFLLSANWIELVKLAGGSCFFALRGKLGFLDFSVTVLNFAKPVKLVTLERWISWMLGEGGSIGEIGRLATSAKWIGLVKLAGGRRLFVHAC